MWWGSPNYLQGSPGTLANDRGVPAGSPLHVVGFPPSGSPLGLSGENSSQSDQTGKYFSFTNQAAFGGSCAGQGLALGAAWRGSPRLREASRRLRGGFARLRGGFAKLREAWRGVVGPGETLGRSRISTAILGLVAKEAPSGSCAGQTLALGGAWRGSPRLREASRRLREASRSLAGRSGAWRDARQVLHLNGDSWHRG